MENTLKRVLEAAERIYGPSSRAILGRSRTSDVVDARDAAIWAYRELTGYPTGVIGNRFNRERTSICFSVRRTADRITTNEKYRNRINQLLEAVK